jgi:hypothetical protein
MPLGVRVLGLNNELSVLVSLYVELFIQRLIRMIKELRLCGLLVAVGAVLRSGLALGLSPRATTGTALALILKFLSAIGHIIEERVRAKINFLIKSFFVTPVD